MTNGVVFVVGVVAGGWAVWHEALRGRTWVLYGFRGRPPRRHP